MTTFDKSGVDMRTALHTPKPGADFEKITGERGGYTFHKRTPLPLEQILAMGGSIADEVIEDWFDYEMKNNESNLAYDGRERYADAKYNHWNKIWELAGLSPILAGSMLCLNCRKKMPKTSKTTPKKSA